MMFWRSLLLKPAAWAAAALLFAAGPAAAQLGQVGYNRGFRGDAAGYNPYLYAPFNFDYVAPKTAPLNPYNSPPFYNPAPSPYPFPPNPNSRSLRLTDYAYPEGLAPYRSAAVGQATTAPADTKAHVRLIVPANADVWFDADNTSQTGGVREYVSPPLTPGKNYAYQVRVRWTEDGRPVDQTRKVTVRAGSMTTADFTKP
jgi:uncharacterized protein (TIGR03000 family)